MDSNQPWASFGLIDLGFKICFSSINISLITIKDIVSSVLQHRKGQQVLSTDRVVVPSLVKSWWLSVPCCIGLCSSESADEQISVSTQTETYVPHWVLIPGGIWCPGFCWLKPGCTYPTLIAARREHFECLNETTAWSSAGSIKSAWF